MMLGLYSFGDREAVLVPADFKYVEFSDKSHYDSLPQSQFNLRYLLSSPKLNVLEICRNQVQWIQEVGNKSLVEAPLPVGAPFTGMMLGLYSFGPKANST
jgi:hypothetical protein